MPDPLKPACRDKEIVVTHAASGAKDKVKFTTYGFRFVTPAGDPEIDPCSGVAFSGRNEFTYDDESSKLMLTLCVAVDPDVDDSVAETLQGRFTLPSIEGAELVWDDDGDGSVNAVEDFNDGYCFGTYAEYQGYPARNEGFGRKTVKFTCGGVTISQDFEVFFPKLGKNHPPCTDCPGCSNWFYYWKLGDVCSIPGNARWAATAGDDGLMGWMDYKLKLIFLTDLAAENEDELDIGQKEITVVRPVYGISTIEDPFGFGGVTSASEGERGYRYEVTESGTSNITINVQSFKIGGKGRGIGCVAAVAAHEQCHLAIRDRLDAQYAVYDAMNELEQIGEIYGIGSKEYAEYELERKRLEFMCADKDQVWGDRVCDGDEIDGYLGLQSDPGNRDTYGMVRISNDYSEYGDNEVRARYVEAQGLESRYHVEKDWSDPGCQHENPYGPLQETEGEK